MHHRPSLIPYFAATFLILAILAWSHPSRAWSADTKPFGQPTVRMSLLEGRLYVLMPQAAVNEARWSGIMEPFASDLEETRLVLDSGDRRFVLMAAETFQFADGRFRENAVRAIARWNRNGDDHFEIYPDEMVAGIRMVRFAPRKLLLSQGQALVGGAYVMHTDGMVQVLALYVNGPAAEEPEACLDMAKEVLASLVPGERLLHAVGGVTLLTGFDGGRGILVDTPAGWVHTTNIGVDFVVHLFREINVFGEDQPNFGLYLGNHPSFHGAEGWEGDRIFKFSKELLGKNAQWAIHENYEEEGYSGRWTCEACVPASEVEPGLAAHVFMSADDPGKFSRPMDIVRTMRFNSWFMVPDLGSFILGSGLLFAVGAVLFLMRYRFFKLRPDPDWNPGQPDHEQET